MGVSLHIKAGINHEYFLTVLFTKHPDNKQIPNN